MLHPSSGSEANKNRVISCYIEITACIRPRSTCIMCPADKGSKFFWHYFAYLPNYTANHDKNFNLLFMSVTTSNHTLIYCLIKNAVSSLHSVGSKVKMIVNNESAVKRICRGLTWGDSLSGWPVSRLRNEAGNSSIHWRDAAHSTLIFVSSFLVTHSSVKFLLAT
jgi:hypothetical protein